MTEVNQNIGGKQNPFVKGDTKQLTILVKEEDANGQLQPKNLTGLQDKRYQVRKDGVLKIQKESGDIQIVNGEGTSDALRFTLTPGDTVNLDPDVYDHEAEIVDAAGNVSTVMKGFLEITDQLIA